MLGKKPLEILSMKGKKPVGTVVYNKEKNPKKLLSM